LSDDVATPADEDSRSTWNRVVDFRGAVSSSAIITDYPAAAISRKDLPERLVRDAAAIAQTLIRNRFADPPRELQKRGLQGGLHGRSQIRVLATMRGPAFHCGEIGWNRIRESEFAVFDSKEVTGKLARPYGARPITLPGPCRGSPNI
jgi:hypothetical protein